ncbi:PAS domain-containing protein [Sorangium cellulosum]|uniref:histidine kinase n=1 Tax=Sorangium cellulosum TaxID=56 RepID=A0A2L0EYA5_SORCE|nr:ATP-binding protein [Sorangium cellulosum]AUX44276.1 PAS domain-containing protein [Sorangium cellulosum]
MFSFGFGQLADVLPEPVLLVSTDGLVVEVNQRARQEIGAAIAGRSLFELCADDRAQVAALLKRSARVRQPTIGRLTLREGRRYRAEGAVVRPSSEGAPALVMLRLIHEQAALAAFVGLNDMLAQLRREITLERQAQRALEREREWLRVTLVSIGDAVIATDVEGRIVFTNPVAQELTGWAERDALGRPIDEVFRGIHETTREPAENPAARVLREGIVVGLANHTVLVARDGRETPIDDSAAPIRDANGDILGAVLVFRGIAARRALERLADQRLAELVQADRRKNEFLAMLAHELRNPMAAILTASAVLGTPGEDPGVIAYASSVVDRQVRHMARLVDDLLDVARISQGKISLRMEVVDVARTLERAIETSRRLIEAGRHQLHVSFEAGLPPVKGDSARLEQVFCNLLDNAAKYTPPGGQVWLSARGEGELVVVSVRDTGVGIPPDLLPNVFEVFVQGEQSLHRAGGGLGVGLSLVKRLVELHGGTCSCASPGLGGGAEFVVRLPALRGESAAERAREQTPVVGGKRLRVLVVDDNEDAVTLLTLCLKRWGHDVAVAHDGLDALALAREYGPDVAVLDIGLPGIDGYELARRLRREPSLERCMLIAASGYGQDIDRQRAFEAGFDEHLLKPVELAALMRLLAKAESSDGKRLSPRRDCR